MVHTFGNTACSLMLLAAAFPAVLAAQDETPRQSAETAARVGVPGDDASTPAAMTPPTLAAVVEQLSVASRKKFADLLAKDWQSRPEWAEMLIVLLKGDTIGPATGWFKSREKKCDWKWISE